MTVVSETRKSARQQCRRSGCARLPWPTARTPTMPSCFTAWPRTKSAPPGLRFTHTLCDIETLNQKAREGVYDVTAISFHAYPYVQDKYALMSCGGSVGEGYGPMIVSPRAIHAERNQDQAHCRSRHADDRLSCAAVVCAGSRNRSRALRSDHSAGAGRKIRSRTDHSRRPVDLRQVGPAPHRRSRPVVAEGDRLAVAAGRQCDSPRPGSGTDARGHGSAAREHSIRARSSRRSARRMRCSLPAISTRNRPTSSSACT